MTQEMWFSCDGCGNRVRYDNSADRPLAGWVRIDLKIATMEGMNRQFDDIDHRLTCCSTACVGAFFEQYAKEFEGQLELVPADGNKAKK